MKTHKEFSDLGFSESEILCRKHPNPSAVGICAYCLKDRLVRLVCSDCGEQRLSSCSCSDASSSYRNSCSALEVGSVGRISFLIENEKIDSQLYPVPEKRVENLDQIDLLRRSSSCCSEIKNRDAFWRIKRLFSKKRSAGCGKDGGFCDGKSRIGAPEYVSRSRSVCSFSGGRPAVAANDSDEAALSTAKVSNATTGTFLDFLNESETRFRGLLSAAPDNQFDRLFSVQSSCDVFPVKESDFIAMDESDFIDLKLDSNPEWRQESSDAGASAPCKNGENVGGVKSPEGSCKITLNEGGLRRGSRGNKVLKWIFKPAK